jgi:hypothetical protein
MTPEEKTIYKKLSRQVDEAYIRLYDRGTGGRIPSVKPNLFNNRLARMKKFLSSLSGNYSKQRYMRANYIN